MKVCDICGKRKVRHIIRKGVARTGPQFVVDAEGRKKLAPCNGDATRLCRSCLK